jgi:sterol carrier protein 2
MTKFYRPGKHDKDYMDLAEIAIKRALRDAGIEFAACQQAYAGYVYGDSTCGQRAVYTVGTTGIPIVNVNNNCSTGSTALYLAHNAIAGRQAECVLAVGFEKMFTGSLKGFFTDRSNPLEEFVKVNFDIRDGSKAPMAPQLFGNAGIEHMEKYGTKLEHFGKIAEKNHRHSVNNPYSQFRDLYTLEQIMKSPTVHSPLTKL